VPDIEKTTHEEARSCPICGEYGELQTTTPGPRFGSKVNIYLCMNELCRWYNTGWVVQINADGSIPNRKKGMKDFPDLKMPDDAMKNYFDRLIAEDKESH
jgi:hypothetical protein